jgi:hypothetical protein
MIEIRFDKTKDEVALLIWFLVDHSVLKISFRFLEKKITRFLQKLTEIILFFYTLFCIYCILLL